jgi:nicotinamidase-related amidase
MPGLCVARASRVERALERDAHHGPVRLLELADSVLIVIDVQPGFGPPNAVVARIAWLAGVATALGIPVLVTEEDPARNGPTAPGILARVPAGTTATVKPVFGLADTPEILAAVEALCRHTAVLAGFETDVCVTHSALGLLDRGYRVAVVTDATGSPGEMHDLGLRRMRDAGATLVHAKGVYYEWVRTLEAARAFEAANPDLADPPGFSL